MKNIKLYLFSALWAVSLNAFSGDGRWVFHEKVDAITDEKIATASITTAAGESFALYYGPDNEIWANFSLSDKTGDMLHEQWPILRIDQADPVKLEGRKQYLTAAHRIESATNVLRRRLGESPESLKPLPFGSEPKWINFSVPEFYPDLVSRLSTGNRLLVRAFLLSGGSKDITFSLAGSGAAIKKLLASRGG